MAKHGEITAGRIGRETVGCCRSEPFSCELAASLNWRFRKGDGEGGWRPRRSWAAGPRRPPGGLPRARQSRLGRLGHDNPSRPCWFPEGDLANAGSRECFCFDLRGPFRPHEPGLSRAATGWKPKGFIDSGPRKRNGKGELDGVCRCLRGCVRQKSRNGIVREKSRLLLCSHSWR